jgi:hypothetical protein
VIELGAFTITVADGDEASSGCSTRRLPPASKTRNEPEAPGRGKVQDRSSRRLAVPGATEIR